MENLGIFGVLILVADIYAILQIAQSGETTGKKAIWIAIVLLLPFLGVVAWYFLGPRQRGG